jgi:LacI family repressor for deo operon, udp, cdd, tsx, nupC, and nupG
LHDNEKHREIADLASALPTIQDVARSANVSTATVSRALSFPEKVSETTRLRVLQAVEETGYAVNQIARNLRRRTTGAIVVLVPNLGNQFFSLILAGIESAASRAGYTVLISDTRPSAGGQILVDYVRNNRADGLISLDGALPPHILTNGSGSPGGRRSPALVFACEWRGGFPSVRFDNAGGAEMAVDHLAALGHSRIGHVTGPLHNVLTKARLQGFTSAMARHRFEIRDDWLVNGDFMLQSGVLAARTWLQLTDRPSAMFLANDEMAFGFISELHRHGVTTPRDVSVVGFDDIDMAGHYVPALTTVRQPRHEIGEAAFAAFLEAMAGDASTPVRILPATLIVRESTRAV